MIAKCPHYRPQPDLHTSSVQVSKVPTTVIGLIRLSVRTSSRHSRNGRYGISAPDHSALMPVDFTTLPHFSVSSAISFPKSLGEPASTVQPRSASRAFIFGSARAALISLLSFSTISAGVSFGAPTPHHALAS